MPETPAYLRIAAELHDRIVSGDLPPGAKLPSESRIMATYGVSRTVAKYAIGVLKGDGLVEGRAGSGVYVREVVKLVREGHRRDQRSQPGPSSPFARDAQRAGHVGAWTYTSAAEVASERVAQRLAMSPGDPVMVTRYRFTADGAPVQLSTSWEPLAVTGGTAIELPEAGPVVGVVARFDLIGVRIDESVERVTSRAAYPAEVVALGLPTRGAHVMAVYRTYFAAGVPMETADIVFPGDRYELVYRLPID